MADKQPDPKPSAIQPIEGLNRNKENIESFAKNYPSKLLLASFCTFVKQQVQFLLSSPSTPSVQETGSRDTLKASLKQLKDLLAALAETDLSQHAPYIEQLALSWHTLFEIVHVMELLERKDQSFLLQVKALLQMISSYPAHTDHPLGFYLQHSPGAQWLPFPFIEILKALHEESALHKINPTRLSSIEKWCRELETLISKPE